MRTSVHDIPIELANKWFSDLDNEDGDLALIAHENANKQLTRIHDVVEGMGDIVNNFSYGKISEIFNYLMSHQHRTLQQNVTRLMLMWIEYAASDEYRFDPRNQGTHEKCKKILELWAKDHSYSIRTLPTV